MYYRFDTWPLTAHNVWYLISQLQTKCMFLNIWKIHIKYKHIKMLQQVAVY